MRKSRRAYAENPLSLDWDYKADWIQCRADAIDCHVYEIRGRKILAASEEEAAGLFRHLRPRARAADAEISQPTEFFPGLAASSSDSERICDALPANERRF